MITLWKPAAALSVGLLTVIWGASTPAPLHAQPNIEAVFHALDRDANKAVSLDELVNHPSNPAVKQLHGSIGGGVHARMAAMHGHGTGSNHDHPATQELRAHFAKMDANSDGSLTIEEFRAFHDKLLAMHAGH